MPQAKKGPDGQKPTAVPPNSKHAYNVDERAAAREKAPITIGGQVYHRRRKNWEVTRALRKLLREQDRCGLRIERLRKQILDLPSDADLDEIDRLEDEIEGFQDKGDDLAFEIIAMLLRNGEDGETSPEQLKEWLDAEDAGDLAAMLAGGGEPDPTSASSSSS